MVEGSIAIENARIVTCVPPAGGGPLRGDPGRMELRGLLVPGMMRGE